MDLGRPLQVVTPTVDGDVITVLARADSAFTPAQVRAITARHSVEGVRRSLNRLAEQGVVDAQRTTTAVLYSLNRDHVAASALLALSDLRSEFLERVRSRFATWDPAPAYAAIFGSAVTGSMRVDSDVDLFVVRPADVDPDDDTWQAQLHALASDATRWTGNDVRVLEMATSDIGPGAETRDPVLADIRAEGSTVHGSPGWLRDRLRPRRRR